MAMEEILAHQTKTEAFRKTPVGAAFFKFKSSLEKAVRHDTELSFNHGSEKTVDRLWNEARAAEGELRAILERLS